ncbi:hypothetical protein MTO96_032418 [Rhipicephalus appendiculatus]
MEGSDFSISDEDEDFSPGDLEVRERASPVRPYKYKYKCPLCPKAFGTARDMGIHVRRHEGCKPYTCKDCDKAFCTPFELDQHARSHTGERPFKCPTCACAFATLLTMLRHSNTHRRANCVMYRCSVCPSIFRYAVTCTAHERTHRADCMHQCKTCNRVFPQAFNLKRHMRLHDMDKAHSCATCERSFYNKERFDTHVQSCGQFRKCEVCGKGFREEARLQAHIASQHDSATEPSKEARLGDSSFEQAPADDQSSSEDGSGSNGTLSADQFACHVCDKTFKQNGNLKTHLKSHDRVVQFECDICGLGFTLKHHYKRHRRNKHYKD